MKKQQQQKKVNNYCFEFRWKSKRYILWIKYYSEFTLATVEVGVVLVYSDCKCVRSTALLSHVTKCNHWSTKKKKKNPSHNIRIDSLLLLLLLLFFQLTRLCSFYIQTHNLHSISHKTKRLIRTLLPAIWLEYHQINLSHKSLAATFQRIHTTIAVCVSGVTISSQMAFCLDTVR